MNKIYFAGSIRGGREDVALYRDIVEHLRKHGEVFTEHVADMDLGFMGEIGLTPKRIHDRDVNWLDKANILVAEVTIPSLGVGYEIGRTVERNRWAPIDKQKHIFCLYRPQEGRSLSPMISGSDGVRNFEYNTLDQAKSLFDYLFQDIKRKLIDSQ